MRPIPVFVVIGIAKKDFGLSSRIISDKLAESLLLKRTCFTLVPTVAVLFSLVREDIR